MVRPCFLVIDREYSGSISTRKLVIETAKFNVITAYSSAEAIATLREFPNVNGTVLDAGIRDMPCADLVAALKLIKPGLTVIAVGTPMAPRCDNADHFLGSFDPRALLALLEQLEADYARVIEQRNEELDGPGSLSTT